MPLLQLLYCIYNTYYDLTFHSPGSNSVIIELHCRLSVSQLEVEQCLVPAEVETEGGALTPLILCVAQEV